MNINNDTLKQIYVSYRKSNKHTKVLVFLDFDGVINIPTKEEYLLGEPARVSNVNKLCLKYNADIVLSTSWRTLGFDYCKECLNQWGLDSRINIVGSTPVHFYPFDGRDTEIRDYLIEHNDFKSFVIIDDINMKDLSEYAVLTKFEDGFNDANYHKAEKILNDFK